MNKATVRNLGLSVGSLVLTLTAFAVGIKWYANVLEIYDPSFRYENKIGMWSPDATIGFVNKNNFHDYAWGNVPIITDDRGFRAARIPGQAAREGVHRIIAVGDSVMWGTGVREEDSFLGLLEEKLNQHQSYEVMNAGVVGYSTYQELLFLEKYGLALKPDIVLINYCFNDMLPTEDPFGNVRQVYSDYLSGLLLDKKGTLTSEMRRNYGDLIRILNSTQPVWTSIEAWKGESLERAKILRQVLVETPIARMAELSKRLNTRLIYILIPTGVPISRFDEELEELKTFLESTGIEFLDTRPDLRSVVKDSHAQGRTHQHRFEWLWRWKLGQILLLWRIDSIHRNQWFLDPSHPTRKGNQLIAERLYRRLREPPCLMTAQQGCTE